MTFWRRLCAAALLLPMMPSAVWAQAPPAPSGAPRADECAVEIDNVTAFRARTAALPSNPLPNATCTSATDAPICVFKTWVACEVWSEPKWCAAVGVRGVKFDSESGTQAHAELPKPARPWALDLTDPAVARVMGRVVGVRKVEQNRCYLRMARVDAIENAISDYIGHDEVMYLLPNAVSGKEDIREEIFVQQKNGRWQLTGWQMWQEATACVYSGYEDDPYFGPTCKKHAPVYPWALQSEYEAQMRRTKPELPK